MIFLRYSLLVVSVLFLTNCNNEADPSGVNVEGVWRAQVSVESCSPADVCSTAGFTLGGSLPATMNLSQSATAVDGNYTYDNSGIDADVQGNVAGNQLVLNGTATNPLLGRATVHFTGTVAGDRIEADVSHEIMLVDGRAATVGGSGIFTR